MHRPSFRNGFAPRDGGPRWPSLWNECALAIAPGLGPTGTVLRDFTQLHATGTISNMSLTTGWNLSRGAYSLLFDGTNDAASIPLKLGGLMKIGVSVWFDWQSYANNDSLLMEFTPNFNNSGSGNRGFIFNPNDSSSFNFSVGMSGPTSLYNMCNFTRPAAGWHHLAVNFDRTLGAVNNMTVWLDGLRINTNLGVGQSMAASTFVDSSLFLAGRNNTSLFGNTRIDDVRVYRRLLTHSEAVLLSRRRCIAYELDDEAFGYYSAPASGAARLRRILAGLP